jgi:predicted esterase
MYVAPTGRSDRMARIINVATQTHGRVLVEDAAVSPFAGVIVAFHGYGERADDVLAQVGGIPGADRWTRVAPQALHRFYSRRHERVVASWMTRDDREMAIADNLAYVDRVLQEQAPPLGAALVFLGFSQGASMAYRAAILGSRPAAGVIAIAGDIPPEVKLFEASSAWPPVLIGAGTRDDWFAARLDGDVAFLRSRGVAHDVVRFDGAHEWTGELQQAIGAWLQKHQ